MDPLLAFLAGAGVTLVAQWLTDRRSDGRSLRSEKREAYIVYLALLTRGLVAIHGLQVKREDSSASDDLSGILNGLTEAKVRVELLGSPAVVRLSRETREVFLDEVGRAVDEGDEAVAPAEATGRAFVDLMVELDDALRLDLGSDARRNLDPPPGRVRRLQARVEGVMRRR